MFFGVAAMHFWEMDLDQRHWGSVLAKYLFSCALDLPIKCRRRY